MIKQRRICSRLLFGMKGFFPHFILKLSAFQLTVIQCLSYVYYFTLTVDNICGNVSGCQSVLLHSLICPILLKNMENGPEKMDCSLQFYTFSSTDLSCIFVQISEPADRIFKIFIISIICFIQGPERKVLEENMVNFGQQLPDVGTGNGCQYSVKHTLQGMQNKLKEAARKISILSQEKQQLIEMGNRLRAELGMALKEGKFILKKNVNIYLE